MDQTLLCFESDDSKYKKHSLFESPPIDMSYLFFMAFALAFAVAFAVATTQWVNRDDSGKCQCVPHGIPRGIYVAVVNPMGNPWYLSR